MKPKLAYIDHSFHKKTKSSDFLRNILVENFEVIDIWDESWNGGVALTVEFINSQNFEYVLFFQSLLPIDELKKIKAKIVWVPMYDGIVGTGKSFWLELSTVRIKIISFSSTLGEKLKKIGIDVLNVQYFFDSIEFKKIEDYSKKKIFFWQRTKFNFNDVKKLIGDQKIDQFILKLDPDPGYKAIFPSQNDIKKYNIKIVRGFLSKEEYMSMLFDSNIFVSPRKFEGIGMSFLEAMTMGLAVIAIDNPTMNEYITNGKNGYLFKLDKLKEIDFSDFEKKGKNARIYCGDIFIKWKISRVKIVEFINLAYKPAIKLSLVARCYIKFIKKSYRILLKLRLSLKWL